MTENPHRARSVIQSDRKCHFKALAKTNIQEYFDVGQTIDNKRNGE